MRAVVFVVFVALALGAVAYPGCDYVMPVTLWNGTTLAINASWIDRQVYPLPFQTLSLSPSFHQHMYYITL